MNHSNDSQTRLLSFSLGQEKYAIPLLRVKEVIAIPDVTPVPYSPAHFMGIMNLRGQVISVIDLRTKLGMKKSDHLQESAVIIVDLDPVYIGITVDSVDSVLNISENEMSAPPEMETKKKSDYITSVVQKDQKLILVLDIGKTLDVEDLQTMKRHAGHSAAA
jgi:purine-binding chemotaxis protein CheW